MDRQIVLKLLSGEEIVAMYIQETDYELSVLFPMLVKHIPKLSEGRIIEAITLAPYSHFSAADEYTFNKSHILFCKDLNSKYLNVYAVAVDDFVSVDSVKYNSVKDLTNSLDNVFNDQNTYDEIHNEPPTKAIH